MQGGAVAAPFSGRWCWSIDGKRRRHYGPFATLTVLVGVTALAVNTLGSLLQR